LSPRQASDQTDAVNRGCETDLPWFRHECPRLGSPFAVAVAALAVATLATWATGVIPAAAAATVTTTAAAAATTAAESTAAAWTTTAAAATTTAATRTTLSTWLSFVHDESAALEVLAIQLGDGLIASVLLGHGHEAEAA
jgi:hypothetical protein